MCERQRADKTSAVDPGFEGRAGFSLPFLQTDGSPRKSLLGLEVRNAGLVKSRGSCGLMTLWRARLAKEHQAQTLVLMVRIGMTTSFYMMAVISESEELAIHPAEKCMI